jgi:hopanoid biosynthesis associated protein HpnK
MKKLIVNADDFGLTAKVNEAIIDGHWRGLISSTSLLANGEAFESAVDLSRQAPRLGIGVHLNLSEGKPVAPGSSIPSLTQGTEFFARAPGELSRAIFLGQVSTADIERELRAQIEKVLAAGIAPTHLDSHKHVHALPALGKIAIKVAGEYEIGAIRGVAESSSALVSLLRRYPRATATIIRQRLNGCALGLISRGWRRQLRRAGIACASRFYGLTATGFLDEEILGEILSRLPDGTSELMCHPGIVDNALRRTPTRLLDQREVEYRALTQPAMKRLVQDLGIQLVNYREMIGEKTVRVSPEEGSNPNQLSA